MQDSSCDCGRPDAAERIIDCAELLFAERGYDGVSIADIAKAAGISKANVFHHFANKAELYAAALQRCSGPLQQLLGEFRERQGPTAEALSDTLQGHLQQMLESQNAVRLMMRELLGGADAESRAGTDRMLSESFGMAVDAIRAMQDQGRIAADVEPIVLAATAFGAHLVFFLCRDVLAGHAAGAGDPQGFDQALLRILVGGVLPPPEQQSE
jgi:TetR/AcrR family transcriptional regulator